jgi:hypothetical protein
MFRKKITIGSSNQRFVSIAVKYSLLMAPDRNIVTKKIILNAVWARKRKNRQDCDARKRQAKQNG